MPTAYLSAVISAVGIMLIPVVVALWRQTVKVEVMGVQQAESKRAIENMDAQMSDHGARLTRIESKLDAYLRSGRNGST